MKRRQTFSKVVFVSFALSILFFLIGASGYGVIQIDSIQKLQKIGNDAGYPLNGEYELTQNIDASDTTGWNSGAGFKPIGTSAQPFTGKFDGKNYKVQSLYIKRASEDYIGLFGYVGTGAEIKNVGLSSATVSGNKYTGVLIGYNQGTISNCNAVGNVTASGDYAGGLIGYNTGNITTSYTNVSVKGLKNSVGGLVGYNTAQVDICYSTGAVQGSSYDVGGLIGHNHNTGVIKNSYSKGSVSGLGSVGGLAGYSEGLINKSYSTGSVSGGSRDYNSLYFGGLVGRNNGTVSSSYSTGSVSASANDEGFFGGLIGVNDKLGAVLNCYSTGSVSGYADYDSYNSGLIAWNLGTITTCYSTGKISGTTYYSSYLHNRGLVATNSGIVDRSYWDKETSGQTSSSGGTGKTTAEMKKKSTYSEWDFDNVWGIVENSTYPYLRWQYVVPNVTGLSRSEAESKVTNAGYVVGTVSQQCSDTVATGKVISQSPSASTQVSPGSSVNIVVSTGPCPVPVPNVVGMSQTEASTAITAGRLVVGTVSQQCSDTVATGKVISQSPNASTQVSPGSSVNIVVSTGPCPVPVPNVVGMSQTEASTAITAGRLVVGTVSQQCSDTVATGKVISQSPSAGEQVSPGSSVSIVISTGLCPVSVPDITGMTQAEAITVLNGVRLSVGKVSQQCNNDVTMGKVISQNPEANTQVLPGNAVDIVISTGVCISVPDMVGKPQAEAEALLTGAGLVVGTITSQCNDVIQQGNIISHTPPAGTEVSSGSSVNIVVSVGACISVPDLLGKTEPEVQTLLTSNNLELGAVVQQCSDTVAQGHVISQEPAEGSILSPGEKVDIVVSNGPCHVNVPNGIGKTQSEITTILTTAGLVLGKVSQQCNDVVPSGKIINQTPSPGTQVEIGSAVDILVSIGPCVVAVPNVIGKTETEVRSILSTTNLVLGSINQQCSNTVPSGQVINQLPVGGTEVSWGSIIDIVISTGPCTRQVPDVVNKTETQARSAITTAGLTIGSVVRQCDNLVPKDTVISQNPVAGVGVASGNAVDLVVSSGPCVVETNLQFHAYSGVDHVYVVWEGSMLRELLGYRLYRGEKESGPFNIIAGLQNLIKETSYRDYDVQSGRTYWYKLDIVKQDTSVQTLGPVRVEGGKIHLWISRIKWKQSSGKEIRVPVNIGNAMGLLVNTMNFEISYNSPYVIPIRVEKTAVSNALQIYYNTSEANVIKIGLVPSQSKEGEQLRGEGHIFDLIFNKQGEDIADNTCIPLSFNRSELYDSLLQQVPVETEDGEICIQSDCIRGDVNGNGSVGMEDAVLLLRQITRRDWGTDWNCAVERGDMNGDGILDVADVSMLMRWSVGLNINPPQTGVIGGKAWTKAIDSNVEVKVVGGSPSGEEMDSYSVGVELSSIGGLAGMDLSLSIATGLRYKGLLLGDNVSTFKHEVETGEGYVRVSISSDTAVEEDVQAQVLVLQFGVDAVTGNAKEERNIEVREVRLKGQYGDDFRWYGDVKREDGVVTICPAVKDVRGMTWDDASDWLIGAGYKPDKVEEARLDMGPGKVIRTEPGAGVVLSAGCKVVLVMSKAGTKEQLIEALKSDFGSVDSNGDGQVSWLEASAKYPGLTQEVFNQVDANSDGSISKSEAGIAGQEGEGSIQPTEGEGSAQPTEGEGSTETKQGCGCFGGKSLGNDTWWKYLLDVILFGMLIVSMSGMRRRR